MFERVYATPAEFYHHWGEQAPDPADEELPGVLRRASERVDDVLAMSARGYDVDALGMPVYAEHVRGMRRAVCELVRWWEDSGDETGSGSQGGSIGSLRLPDTAAPGPGRDPEAATMPPGALRALRTAGLLVY
jgi:hypothetical protein